jgi:thiosulfate/3-mercaptopyruvate sulfurtransferase
MSPDRAMPSNPVPSNPVPSGEGARPNAGSPAAAQVLISVSSLARALHAERHERPVVFDVRWRLGGPPGIESYLAGHIPSAVFLDLDRDLCGPPGRAGRHPLPAAAAFQDVMRRAGVSGRRPVVVYDDADATAAARAWWTLRYFGHHEVFVLDGGYRAWAGAGGPAERGADVEAGGEIAGPGRESGDFTAVPGGMPALGVAEAARLARSGILLDARAPERYRGEVEPVDPVAGHIPGAVSAPTAANVRGDGHFKSAAELRARFAPLGVGVGGGSGAEVGVYCGSGVTAAHEVLALSLIGVPAALYVGSWSEWVADPAHPVAVGPSAG